MGLYDVAGLVTNDPKTKTRIINLLNLLGKKRLTLEQLLSDVDYNERYLRFLITKLRSIRLLMGEKQNNQYSYYLSYESFTTYLKTKYSDAIYNLIKRNWLKPPFNLESKWANHGVRTLYDEQKRSALKAISWRTIATSTGMALIYIFTGQMEITAGFGIGDIILKMMFYFLHERIWNRIEFGRRFGTIESAMRAPITVQSTDVISTLLDKMSQSNIGSIIVNDEGNAVGIITEKDIIERVIKKSKPPDETLAKEVMSSPLLKIKYDNTLREALKTMRKNNLRRLAVTRDGHLVGLITLRRVLEAILDIEQWWQPPSL